MKKCPHCESVHFKAIIKKFGAVKLDGEEAVIIKEGQKFTYEVVECIKCKTKLSNEDLIEDVTVCDCCSKPVKKEDLVNGLCQVCHAMANREDLKDASPEDLIRKVLALEKQVGATNAPKIVAKVEQAYVTEKIVEEKQEIANAKAEEQKAKEEDEEFKKRSEAAKKAAETRRINAEKKKLEETQAAEQNVVADVITPTAVQEESISMVNSAKQEIPVIGVAPLPDDNVPLEANDLPMGDEMDFGDFAPPEMNMSDPF